MQLKFKFFSQLLETNTMLCKSVEALQRLFQTVSLLLWGHPVVTEYMFCS